MIFGIKSYEPPSEKNQFLKFYWGALNRARIALMGTIFGSVLVILPFMLLLLEYDKTTPFIKAMFFLAGAALWLITLICKNPESFTVTIDPGEGLNFKINLAGFSWPLKKIAPKEIIDIGVKCDFSYNPQYQSTHSIIFLCKDESVFKICLAYSIAQTPDSELLRLARRCSEIIKTTLQPAIIGTGKPETFINPHTGQLNFKGVRFNPK